MAILKHIKSRNANYSNAIDYLLFQHDESTGKKIKDEMGRSLLRDEFYMDGLNCDPMSFDKECSLTNAKFHKNKKSSEIKSHHYIISFDPDDKSECGLTGEKAQELCLDLAQKIFPGYQALIVTHTDGHNGSGNIHTHIVINSVRKEAVRRQLFLRKDPITILYVRSHLRLVVDLQKNVKAMQSSGYAHRVKISNLQEMANTIIYVQEHGYNTQTELKDAFSKSQKQLDQTTEQLMEMNADLKNINRQIHYTGQYFAQKAIYTEFLKAKNKGRFRKEHTAEIQAYEEARDWLKSFYPDGKMLSIKTLKERLTILLPLSYSVFSISPYGCPSSFFSVNTKEPVPSSSDSWLT